MNSDFKIVDRPFGLGARTTTHESAIMAAMKLPEAKVIEVSVPVNGSANSLRETIRHSIAKRGLKDAIGVSTRDGMVYIYRKPNSTLPNGDDGRAEPHSEVEGPHP